MTQAQTQLIPVKPTVTDVSEFANLLDTNKFDHLWRVATLFAKSGLVPEHFRGKVEDCFITCQMAIRLGIDPFMLLQKTYVVHGKPGMEATIAIALMNTSGLFENSIDYEVDDPAGKGAKDPGYRVRAWAVRKGTNKRIDGPWVDWTVVKAEGWHSKSGSKWMTIPDLMFRYRAATWFGRLHCPERLMGMNTVDELDDIEVKQFVESTPVRTLEFVTAADGGLQPMPPEGNSTLGDAMKPKPKKRVAAPKPAEEEVVADAKPAPEPDQPEAVIQREPSAAVNVAATLPDRQKMKLHIDAALMRAGVTVISDALRLKVIGSVLGIMDEAVTKNTLKTASAETVASIGKAVTEMTALELLNIAK